ncbi:hypothetical protein SUDANB13_06344 [Streptomyces sp. enrichment culture]
MLVTSHDRGVGRHGPGQVLIGVGVCHQRGEGAVDGPHPQPVADASPFAVFLRQVDPLRSCLELAAAPTPAAPCAAPPNAASSPGRCSPASYVRCSFEAPAAGHGQPCEQPPTSVAGGEYYGPSGFLESEGHPTTVPSIAETHDEAAQRQLWDLSRELTGVRYPVQCRDRSDTPSRPSGGDGRAAGARAARPVRPGGPTGAAQPRNAHQQTGGVGRQPVISRGCGPVRARTAPVHWTGRTATARLMLHPAAGSGSASR